MATRFDVSARLAEGRQAVDNTQNYVWASHLIGYQNADLTLHSAQIRDWYSTEDGMDLGALDDDGAAVQAVTSTADDVAMRQRDQLAALTAAWQGDGGSAAAEFLRKHCETAEQVAASARTAAQALANLRDVLWNAVDAKVAAVTAIDDRASTQRPAWLAAAQTVATGTGDRSAASELVDQQVKPFVDNDIRNDWLAAMHTALAAIHDNYDAATADMTPSAVRFELPGDFGPDPAPAVDDDDVGEATSERGTTPAGLAPATSSAPAAAAPSSPSTPMTSMPAASVPAASDPATAMPEMSTPATPAVPAAVPATSATPASSSLPTTPSSGLDGPGLGLADALRGLLPSSAQDAVPDLPGVDAPTLDEPPTDPADEQDPTETGVADETSEAEDRDDKDNPDDTDDENDENACDRSQEAPPDPMPTAVDTPEPAETPPEAPPEAPPEDPPPPPDAAPPAPSPDASEAGTPTPCETAADELPQAGQ